MPHTRPLLRHRRRTPPGSSPGTLITDPHAQPPVVTVTAYGPDGIEQRGYGGVADLKERLRQWPVVWVNVQGLADHRLLGDLADLFDIHRLALEDVVNLHQRPKVEEYDEHLFIATRAPTAGPRLGTEQVSLFLGKNYVVSFLPGPSTLFDPIMERLRQSRGRIRQAGPDYLAYALIDTIVDGYFPVLERYGEEIEAMETAVLSNPDTTVVSEIHRLRADLLTLRRLVWPQRDMVNALIRESSRFVTDQTGVYLRDCYDHAGQLLDIVETYREIAFGLIDVYLSSISTRMNEVMKVLTIIATIFIPLSFVAGLYGMNFDTSRSPWNMPELHWSFGYPFALAIMAAIAFGLIGYFYHKGWIGGGNRRSRRSGRDGRAIAGIAVPTNEAPVNEATAPRPMSASDNR